MVFTDSQRYLSTRGGSYDQSFEDVVLKGLAADGGLFVPEVIPSLPQDWQKNWMDLSFEELAFELMSLYISQEEIPADDLKDIIKRSYATFRDSKVTPLVPLDASKHLYLLELFCGPTFAFKDGKADNERHHLVVIGATSGDTGSAAIYGLRGKKDASIFILHPKGKVSPVQEAQMTTVLDSNVHNIAVEGSFDDCQDMVKALFADPETNQKYKLAAVNSINWARILAQMTYYVHSYFSLVKSPSYNPSYPLRVVVPSGNFGDIMAGWFTKKMGLPIQKLIVATNENDILDRFIRSGSYTKDRSLGVKETHSPAMDILVSSNFERLLWYLALKIYGRGSLHEQRATAGAVVSAWLSDLKNRGGFNVESSILSAAKADFESQRVSDEQTIDTIRSVYKSCSPQGNATQGTRGETGGYILDPHSAVGVAGALRAMAHHSSKANYISLSTAHPAKFAAAVDKALHGEKGYSFEKVTPPELEGLETKEKRVICMEPGKGIVGVREIIDQKILGSS
ncbi:threonine synthase [Ascosphaera aggregata]|nr:threonine synthase [Ascosphaera aggregata]